MPYDDVLHKSVASVIYELPSISIITRIELLSWRSVRKEDEDLIKEFVKDCTVFSLTEAIVLRTIEIRKVSRTKIPDAIIAATAIVHDHKLITHNTGDFTGIKELTVINPSKLPA